MPSNVVFRKAAKKFGTPLYVYDAKQVRAQCRALRRNFPGAQFHYAVKANAHPALLRTIKSEGIGLETVSRGELMLGKNIGLKKPALSFTCASITEAELIFASRTAGYVHLDSLHQIDLWGKNKLGKNISIRLNQGIGAGHHAHVITGGPDSKFGISLKDVPAAMKLAKKYGLTVTGLAQHIGSNVLSVPIFTRAMETLLKTARAFPEVNHIDFGGGFGIPYSPGESPLDIEKLGKEYVRMTRAFNATRAQKVQFAFEPGRYLVAEAGTLLVSVTDIKSTSVHLFAGVNSGFNHLIRPAMYGSYHPIENVTRTSGKRAPVTIAGNVCESGDLFAIKRPMIVPHLDDVLAIRNAGAYGRSMASTYNQRELPKEVVI